MSSIHTIAFVTLTCSLAACSAQSAENTTARDDGASVSLSASVETQKDLGIASWHASTRGGSSVLVGRDAAGANVAVVDRDRDRAEAVRVDGPFAEDRLLEAFGRDSHATLPRSANGGVSPQSVYSADCLYNIYWCMYALKTARDLHYCPWASESCN